MTYKIIRHYENVNRPKRIVETGLTKEQAQKHCRDPQTNSRTCTEKVPCARTRVVGAWFDGYDTE